MTETGELPEPSQTAGAPARAIERGAPLATMDALREDVHTLGDLVGQVVREQAGDRIFGLVEEVRLAAIAAREGDTPDDTRERALLEWAERQTTADLTQVVRAFTVYFHLINVAEQHHRVRRLHEREQIGLPLPESLAAAVQALREQGTSEARLAALLPALRVHPVFTAHPSEVRRATLLEHLERCAALLAEHGTFKGNPPRRRAIHDALRSAITLVWQTAETRTERPSVLDEVHSVVRVLAGTVYDVAPAVQRALEAAIQTDTPAVTRAPEAIPFLQLGSWVGGDRDGNPFVTPEVTVASARL
ncbi:MAG TPA: phosphoenolpyruvate carboxylase, partial [Ktedonobacterales bacterium]|nr:phosphoenolpyruvate carboxylase [Ktedonobacterales bacterium]